MEDQDELRTRAQHEAALKDATTQFNRRIRILNKVTRSIHIASSRSPLDYKELEGLSLEYQSLLDEISEAYDTICEVSLDSPSQSIVSSFERIDVDSCNVLSEIGNVIRESRAKQSSDQSRIKENESVESLNSSQVKQTESISKLCSQLSLGRLPVPEPDIFSGDPLEFTAWFNSFNTLIRSSSIPDAECIFYLNKYLTGEAKECVKGFLSLCTSEAYYSALELLKERFGSDFVVANAFRQKLRKWPKILNDDFIGLRKFSDYLSQVETAKISNRSLSVLDDEQENRSLLFKIPEFCHKGWAKVAARARVERDPYPSFSAFCKFIRYQSEIVNDPITCLKSSQSHSHGNGYSDSNRSSRSLPNATSQRRYSHATSNQGLSQASISCFYCNKPHLMTNCNGFASLSIDERRGFCKAQRLCFACLRHGHSSRDCQRRMQCSTCDRMHPTILHDDNYRPGAYTTRSTMQSASYATTNTSHSQPVQQGFINDISRHLQQQRPNNAPSTNSTSRQPQQAQAATSHTMNASQVFLSQHVSSMIVPVYLKHSQSNSTRLVYALLDSQSDTSFILDNTLASFNVPSEETVLNLSTMNGSASVHCRKVNGFEVKGYRCKNSIRLPTLFSRPDIPSNYSHIPSASFCNRFEHLKTVSERLMPLQNVEIGLLLGYDVSYVHQPLNVISSKKNEDPYAIETPLGWCVIGSTGRTQAHNQTVCNRIACSELSSVVYKTEATEINPKDLLNVFEQDFNDVRDSTTLSQDDKQFLKLANLRKQLPDGHYEIPMPFKESILELECNISMAEQRLEYLKRKMERSTEYKDEYTSFMNEMIDHKFCEPVPLHELSNPSWYIPHHGVYHRVKKKIRVVFDCSAKSNGRSLNQSLLTGPDLINSLLGILLRFRKEPVAFQCDITKMFLQFYVQKHQRDYLRFLWWDNGNTTQPPSHYRMTRHLFGAVSSMGCANIGLKGIATDYEHIYGVDAGDFIRDCFYVDDGLCSVATDEQAHSLIQRSVAMCKEGGIELAKFVSSSQNVLQSIDPALIAAKVKVDFSEDINERSLGTHWHVNDDIFFFTIQQPPPLYTRRKLLSVIASVFDPMGLVSPFVLLGKQLLQNACALGLNWDDDLPPPIQQGYKNWCTNLNDLPSIKIQRCVKPKDFTASSVELHHFSDASISGYGVCSYLR